MSTRMKFALQRTQHVVPKTVLSILSFLNASVLFLIFAFILCFLAVFLHQSIVLSGGAPPVWLNNFSDFLLTSLGLKGTSAPQASSVVVNFLAVSLSIFAAILPASVFLITRASMKRQLAQILAENPFATHLIKSDQDDFDIMSKYYSGAQRVTVYAGDFDWLKNNEKISETVSRLISEGRIYFVSSKSATEVREAIGTDLFDSVKHRLSFQNSSDMRGSIIEHEGNVRTFIYRYREPRDGDIFICAVRDFGQGRFLLDQIKKLTDQSNTGKSIIIISGLPGSGKTYASEHLTRIGYKRISVGDLFREIVKSEGKEQTRKNLDLAGREYLSTHGPKALGQALIERINGSQKIVFDGIRPIETIAHIRSKFPRSKVVYLEATEPNRLRRLRDRGLKNDDIEAIADSAIEREGERVKNVSDHVVTNNAETHRNLEADLLRIAADLDGNQN